MSKCTRRSVNLLTVFMFLSDSLIFLVAWSFMEDDGENNVYASLDLFIGRLKRHCFGWMNESIDGVSDTLFCQSLPPFFLDFSVPKKKKNRESRQGTRVERNTASRFFFVHGRSVMVTVHQNRHTERQR